MAAAEHFPHPFMFVVLLYIFLTYSSHPFQVVQKPVLEVVPLEPLDDSPPPEDEVDFKARMAHKFGPQI